MKRFIYISSVALLLMSCDTTGQNTVRQHKPDSTMFSFWKSDAEWQKELTPEQYRVLRQCGTELPGTGKYYHFNGNGKYVCAACGQELFDSETKYSSGSGWPSFYDVINSENVRLIEDKSYGMIRTEVKCSRCGSHLGHVFTDGPEPTGLRYCINSVSIDFVPRDSVSGK